MNMIKKWVTWVKSNNFGNIKNRSLRRFSIWSKFVWVSLDEPCPLHSRAELTDLLQSTKETTHWQTCILCCLEPFSVKLNTCKKEKYRVFFFTFAVMNELCKLDHFCNDIHEGEGWLSRICRYKQVSEITTTTIYSEYMALPTIK